MPRPNFIRVLKRVLYPPPDERTPYRRAKAYRYLKKRMWKIVRDALLIIAGIFSAAFGLKGFLLTNHFIDGGATGISLLLFRLTHVPLGLLLALINIPFLLLGWRVISRRFAIKAALAITGLAICVSSVDFPNVTDDNLLVAVFGGFFLGAGIGLAVRGGAVIDGTEVLAIAVSRNSGATIGDVILIINVIIFGTAAYFLGIENAMYSMITYLAASKTLDFLVEGIEEYIGVTIVSTKSAELQEMIINKLGKGITVYQGKAGYGRRGSVYNTDILYTVITRLELNRLNGEIDRIDPNAFVVMNSVKDTRGGITKRRPLH